MELAFDPAKNEVNRSKHGLPLDAFTLLDFKLAYFIEDRRHFYGEQRWRVLAPMAGRLCVAVFTIRGEVYRVISLRKANKRERRIYETARTV
jgi:uncharacterized protein